MKTAIALAILGTLSAMNGLARAEDPMYNDPKQPLEARAQDFLKRLTLEEKIGLLHADSKFSTAAVERLGVPRRWMSDGPQGVREEIGPDTWNPAGWTNDFATAMPANLGLAATFDLQLARDYGNVIGEEAVARGKHIMLGPGVNIMRTPLNGRNAEYLGEDPYLAARMAVNYIEAVQSHGVASCVKHYAANNQETKRETIDVAMDDRTLHEIYLPAFKAAVTEAHAWCVMSAYNKFRGDWCSENDLLLNQVLKKEWGFPGPVMSDWSGTHSTVKAALSGLDLEMGSSGPYDKFYFATPLLEAVKAGQVPMSRIDDMALRNIRVMVAAHMFDPPNARGEGSIMTPEHAAAARSIAESACVLLKNDRSVLPLDGHKIRTLAVIGDTAKAKFAHDGDSAAIKTRYEITPLNGITTRASNAIAVTYVQGYLPPPRNARQSSETQPAATNPALLEEAVAAASRADAVIVCAGLYRWQDQEGKDRKDMKLPAGQDELIARVLAANPHTVVVIGGGGPVEMPWIDRAPAVLLDWYGGSEGGNALARVLFGDVNPSGHLPCTFPKKLEDSPAHTLGPEAYPGAGGHETYAEGLLVGYRWFDTKNVEPLFPFGHGLSYTTFKYSSLDVSSDRDGVLQAEFTVENTGPREGATVAQVYIEPQSPAVTRPKQELKGFAKVALKAGEGKRVQLKLDPDALAYYDPAKKAFVTDAGSYRIRVGDSSRQLPLDSVFTVQKAVDRRPIRIDPDKPASGQ